MGAASTVRSDPSHTLIGGKTAEHWVSEIKAARRTRTEAKPPQNFRDGVVQARVHSDRDRFIASIREDDVCRLAASHHGGDPCVLFQPPVRGSYNIRYFVQFLSGIKGQAGEKWVVRIPLDPCLAVGGESKLESEVAVSRFPPQSLSEESYSHETGRQVDN